MNQCLYSITADKVSKKKADSGKYSRAKEAVSVIISRGYAKLLRVHKPYRVSEPRYSVSSQMVTTTFEFPGYVFVHDQSHRGIYMKSNILFALCLINWISGVAYAQVQSTTGQNSKSMTKLAKGTFEVKAKRSRQRIIIESGKHFL